MDLKQLLEEFANKPVGQFQQTGHQVQDNSLSIDLSLLPDDSVSLAAGLEDTGASAEVVAVPAASSSGTAPEGEALAAAGGFQNPDHETSATAMLDWPAQPLTADESPRADGHSPGSQNESDPISQRALRGHSESAKDASPPAKDEEEFYEEGESSSDDDGRDSSTSSRRSPNTASRRKRRNILPRIMRGQRCGHCHTCLNPQMKKACLTMRQKQMEDLQKRGELPVSMMGQLPLDGSLPKAGPPPLAKPSPKNGADFAGLESDLPKRVAPKPAQPAVDTFTREIQAIANRNGGVEARYLPSLQRMYGKEGQLERRLVLMTVLKQSPPGTLKEAVRNQKIILDLQKWLLSATESKDSRLALRVIETLDKLPVDLTALQSTGIGKTLAKLRKTGPEELKPSALKLVTKWKKAVDGEPATSGEAAKRTREPTEISGPSTNKKTKLSEIATKIAKGKFELPRQSSVDSKESNKPAAAAPMEVDDNAMFQRKRQKSSLQDSVLQMRKTHQIKLLNEEAAKKLRSKEATNSNGESPRVGAQPDDSVLQEASTLVDPPLHPEEPKEELPRTGSKPPPSAFAGAPLSMPLGSSRLSGLGSGITRIGGGGSSLSSLSMSSYQPLNAAARAAAAAARVPDPPSLPKREKAKAVSWVGDDHLVLVRWFRQEDPVVSVQQDAKETTEIDSGAPATAEEAPPPGFVSAAKREHQNEAAALRQQHLDITSQPEEEEAEEAGSSGYGHQPAEPSALRHMNHFRPMIEWPVAYRGPPLAVNRDKEYGIPSAEEHHTPSFHEMGRMVSARMETLYSTAAAVPESPLEPPSDTTPFMPPLRIPCPRMDPAPAPQQVPQAASLANLASLAPALAAPMFQQPAQLPTPPVLQLPQPRPQQPVQGPPRGPPQFAPLPMPAPAQPVTLPGPPRAAEQPNMRPYAASERGGRAASRGRGRARFSHGEDAKGRGRSEGRAAKFASRKAGEGPRPPHLVPCKWHFGGGQGCRNGDNCRFSHNPEHME